MADEKVHYSDQFDPDLEAGIIRLQKEMNVLYDDFKKFTIEMSKSVIVTKDVADSNRKLLEAQSRVDANEAKAQKTRKETLLLDLRLQKAKEQERKEIEKTTVAYQQQQIQQQEQIKSAKLLAAVINSEVNSDQKRAATIKLLTDLKAKENDQTIIGVRRIEAYKRALDNLEKATRLNASTMQLQSKNVGNYNGQFNSLNNSVMQLSREMPAFANSVNTGFMAISNNIPALSDAIKQIRMQNLQLAAEGKPTVSVLKQLAGAVFSWQSVLSVGVTLLTVYGAEIVNWITNTEDATKAAEEAAKELERYDKALDSLNSSYQDSNAIMQKRIELMRSQGKTDKEIYEEERKLTIQKIGQLSAELEVIKGVRGKEEEYEKLLKERIQARLDLQILEAQYDKKSKDDAISRQIEYFENQKSYYVALEEIQYDNALRTFNMIKKWDEKILDYKLANNKITLTEYKAHLAEMYLAEKEFIGLDEMELRKVGPDFNQKESFIKGFENKLQKDKNGKVINKPTLTTGITGNTTKQNKLTLAEQLGIDEKELKAIKTGYQEVYEITKEHIDKMAELSKEKNDRAKEEVQTLRQALRDEKADRRLGLKSNVELAESELNIAIAAQKKTEAEQRKALKRQRAIQSLEQATNMITASSTIIKETAAVPFLTAGLLIAMWGTFFAQQRKAYKETSATKFAKGGTWIEGGKLHSEGGNKYGNVEVERGERMAVFSRSATQKYGSALEDYINAANKGTLKINGKSNKGNVVVNMSTTKLEKGMNKLVSLNEEKQYFENGKKIIVKGNLTKIHV